VLVMLTRPKGLWPAPEHGLTKPVEQPAKA
jgi:hypothetical protein